MVVYFDQRPHVIEVKYEMIDRPTRMRASNAVRRYELLQLEEATEHQFQTLVSELQQMLELDMSPAGVKKLAKKYYNDDEGKQVAMGLHHTGDKLKDLTLIKHLRLHSLVVVNSILLEFEIKSSTAVKLTISIYIYNEVY